jgi:hypothetical protein
MTQRGKIAAPLLGGFRLFTEARPEGDQEILGKGDNGFLLWTTPRLMSSVNTCR